MSEHDDQFLIPVTQYLAKRTAEKAPPEELDFLTGLVRGETAGGPRIMIDTRTGQPAGISEPSSRQPSRSPNPFRTH